MTRRHLARVAMVAPLADPLGCAAALSPSVVVVDVEPLLAPWGTDGDRLALGLGRLSAHFKEGTRIVVATNSRRTIAAQSPLAGVEFISRARKPWKASWWPDPGSRTVIVGDVPIIDGLLAWRLQGIYVVVPHPRKGVPLWPRLLLRLGAPVAALFLRRAKCRRDEIE